MRGGRNTPNIKERGTVMNIYQQNGYKNKKDYLQHLADSYGVDYESVYTLADLLGDSEMFDGLIAALEDVEIMMEGI